MERFANKTEIKNFAFDVYDYIWSRYKFITQTDEKFCEIYSETTLRTSRRSSGETKFFTDDIGKAVLVSQFLLRDYFSHFFRILSSSNFKNGVKLLLSHWHEKQPNIYVKLIEILAIIAEAFLFCDYHKQEQLNVYDSVEWFMECFKNNLNFYFDKIDNWIKLPIESQQLYGELFENLKSIIQSPRIAKYRFRKLHYTDKVLNYLLNSPLTFPVPVYSFQNKEKFQKCVRKNIVYITPLHEISFPEDYDCQLNSSLEKESSLSEFRYPTNDELEGILVTFVFNANEYLEKNNILDVQHSGRPTDINKYMFTKTDVPASQLFQRSDGNGILRPTETNLFQSHKLRSSSESSNIPQLGFSAESMPNNELRFVKENADSDYLNVKETSTKMSHLFSNVELNREVSTSEKLKIEGNSTYCSDQDQLESINVLRSTNRNSEVVVSKYDTDESIKRKLSKVCFHIYKAKSESNEDMLHFVSKTYSNSLKNMTEDLLQEVNKKVLPLDYQQNSHNKTQASCNENSTMDYRKLTNCVKFGQWRYECYFVGGK